MEVQAKKLFFYKKTCTISRYRTIKNPQFDNDAISTCTPTTKSNVLNLILILRSN